MSYSLSEYRKEIGSYMLRY